MPEPTKIPRPFADSGDKNSIPDSSGGLGFASWQEGFPAITGTPFAQGGVAPKRADFNGVFNALSAAVVWAQQGGVYEYDTNTDYEVGNLVSSSGELFICKVANGPSSSLHDPANSVTEAYWGHLYPQQGTFKNMYFSQVSGSYTAPYTGVYRITLKGGGGGGGGGASNLPNLRGLGGGEGGMLIFYQTLTKSQSYSYTIGAGGSGGVIDINGTSGGTTSFNNASVSGGGGGSMGGNITKRPGAGGSNFVVPTGITALKIPGAPGESCGGIGSGTSFVVSYAPCGGGQGGGITGGINPTLGGGGGGSSNASTTGQDGADGYILIEYAG